MTNTLHLRALKIALDLLLASGTLKAYPMATTFVPNSETDQYLADILAEVAAGASAITLSGVSVNIDAANNRVELDSADFSANPVTFVSNKYCLVVDTGNNATAPVIATIDYVEGTVNPTSGPFAITVNSNGHFGIGAVD
jgi:hypothetical protein